MGFSPGVKQRVLERDGHKCARCGKAENLQIHHVVPQHVFPYPDVDCEENALTLCAQCHMSTFHANDENGNRFSSHHILLAHEIYRAWVGRQAEVMQILATQSILLAEALADAKNAKQAKTTSSTVQEATLDMPAWALDGVWHTAKDAADIAGVTKRSLLRWIRTGELVAEEIETQYGPGYKVHGPELYLLLEDRNRIISESGSCQHHTMIQAKDNWGRSCKSEAQSLLQLAHKIADLLQEESE